MKIHYVKFLAFLILLGIGFFYLQKAGVQNVTPDRIRDFLLGFGWWAPLLYIFLYTIRPLFLFPAILLSLTGGLTFGPWLGTLYDLIGASLGAYLAFGIARKMGRETVQKWLGKRFVRLDEKSIRNGFQLIFVLRLIPLIPFDGVNYGAGLSKVRFRDYAAATTLGILPGAFAYNFLGHSLHNIFSFTFVFAMSFVVALAILPVVYKKMKQRKMRQTTDSLKSNG